MKKLAVLPSDMFSIKSNKWQLSFLRSNSTLIFALVVIIFQFASLTINAQVFVWAKKADISVRSMINPRGNSVIVGNFGNFVTFEDLKVIDTEPLYPHEGNIFWGKYLPSGSLKYMYINHGAGYVGLISSDIDSEGNLYMLANYENSVTIGNIPITGDNGINSYFIAKIDTAGQPLWIKTFQNNFSSGQSNIILSKIACDREGNIFINGLANGYTLDGIPLSATGSRLFFAKLDKQDGMAIWARKVFAQEQSLVNILDIAFDPNDDVYLTGEFLTDCTFEGGISLSRTSNTIKDAYVCKFDRNGAFKWISQIPGDPNIYTVGLNFSDTTHLTYVSSNRINHYDSNGQLTWQNNITSPNNYYTSIAKDKKNDYLSVHLTDPFIYDNTILSVSDSNGNGAILKIDPVSGTLLWHTDTYGSTGFDYLSSNQKGLLQFSGKGFSPILHFGDNQLISPTSANADLFYELGFNAMISDTSYNTGNNVVYGKIYNDTIANCQWNNEPILRGFTVMAEPGPYFTVSDSLGDYILKLDTGNYFISQINPNNHGFLDSVLCTIDSVPVYFAVPNSAAVEHDFGNKHHLCTLLTLGAADIMLPENDLSLHYDIIVCNEGADTSKNTILSLKYPGNISFPILSNPLFSAFNILDSTLTIPLDNIPPQSCITVSINDSLVSGSIMRDILYKYNISVIPSNSCYLSDSVYSKQNFNISMPSPVGIGKNEGLEQSILFPNPTAGIIFVKGIKANLEVEVSDILGRKVKSTVKKSKDIATIDISNAPDGIYIISLKSENQCSIFKIIKNKK